MQIFREQLIRHFNFTEKDWQVTRSFFTLTRVPAKGHFIKAGYVADQLGFVKTGLLAWWLNNFFFLNAKAQRSRRVHRDFFL